MKTVDCDNLVPLSVDQYHRMIDQGILHDGDSIELIDGLLIRKDRAGRGGPPMTHGLRHVYSVRDLQWQFRPLEQMGFFLHSQLPVALGGIQEPEPDLAVVRGSARDYLRRLPGPEDIAAIMEVSDSSLAFDRSTKQRLYTCASIPICWIVNLVDRQIEVCEQPRADGTYAQRTDYKVGQTVTLVLGPGVECSVVVADVIPE